MGATGAGTHLNDNGNLHVLLLNTDLLPSRKRLEGKERPLDTIVRHRLAVDDEALHAGLHRSGDHRHDVRVLLRVVLEVAREDAHGAVGQQVNLGALPVILELARELRFLNVNMRGASQNR